MSFWDTPQRGANSFNRLPPTQAYFDALAATGATWVRLAYDKWPTDERDFLVGDSDGYDGLIAEDLDILVATLDRAHNAGLKVVIVPLSLPLMRWSQNNHGQFDDRLWEDHRNWREAAGFWRDLAQALRDHPAVAAYNLVNEPAPEREGGLPEHAPAAQASAWYAGERGRGRDLPAFYDKLVRAVREVDPHTPVMLDAGWYAAADGFGYWPGANRDARTLYSVHMYEPYQATSDPGMFKRELVPYPGLAPFADGQQQWDAQRVSGYLQGFTQWAAGVGVSPRRLVLGEFGCLRRWPGCPRYLEDVLATAEQAGLHWAFYAFREDAWDGMDYELGTQPVPWAYWKAAEAGDPDPITRQGSPLFEIIQRRLRAASP
ncbi:glycoside hydrolase family 5 protein [Pseudomonas sp. RIT-PI-S]|uniref:glycoside hydrolase family 5 protein n=1 Tax=Pseudomonas sp. RIT-PI-S TaxID=3035295 RepID=UPI0021D9746B|nr:glycoside hydrolase family 5 protein [Pseudomonas sp. RIT-PI-S]